jgi:hypothetical protein
MTQKQIFNQASTPLVRIPASEDGEAVFLHRLQLDPDQLWAMHLWVAPNDWVELNPGVTLLFGVPVGESPASATQFLLSQSSFVAGDFVARKVMDGYAIRGPMDIYMTTAGGDRDPNDPVTLPVAYGYMVRGEGSSREERRFFNISGGITAGDSFQGGQLTTLPGTEQPRRWVKTTGSSSHTSMWTTA